MKNSLLVILLCFLFTEISFSQDEDGKYFEFGIETQQYPTGFLLGICAESGLSAHHALEARFGYNLLDHKDFGEHDSEKGGGLGFTLGYRYYFKPDHQKWFAGIRSDLWFNSVDWENVDISMPDVELTKEGRTDVVVFQPTIITGYRWAIKEHFAIIPTAAFGAEINIKTNGEAVGQGAVLLWGLNLTYRL